jgi:plastocyanin
MHRTGTILAAALAAVALAAAGCGGGGDEEAGDTGGTTTETTPPAVGSALAGTVGPGFTIDLATQGGQAISTLAPGTYTLTVDDKSGIHNFHLTGPGVDVSTSVGGEGQENFQVELQPGTYSFVCDPHASTMNGEFEVTG